MIHRYTTSTGSINVATATVSLLKSVFKVLNLNTNTHFLTIGLGGDILLGPEMSLWLL